MARYGWYTVLCHSCGGYGLVSEYTADGSDFLGAKECGTCNGSGHVWISPLGAIAQYPSGPFVGRLNRKAR